MSLCHRLSRLACVLLVLGMALPTARAGALELRRGIGVHHMMNWPLTTADYQGSPVDAPYVYPPYEEERFRTPERLIEAIGQRGFDFVRLTVDPGPFLFFSGDRRASLDRILVDNVRLFREHGLSVIVDFHPNRQHVRYQPETLESDGPDGLFPDYVDMVARTAGVLSAAFGSGVALELMNEPETGYQLFETGRWHDMLGRMVSAARRRAPDLPLVVTGGQGGSIEGLVDLEPGGLVDDPDVYFSFHYYLPYEFTHQTAPWAEETWPYLDRVPYPPDVAGIGAAVERALLRVDREAPRAERASLKRKIARDLRRYGATAGPERIAEDFSRVSDWAGRYGVPPERILLGEFGVIRSEPDRPAAADADRFRWLRDIREEAERRDFAWAVWVLKDPYFPLVARGDHSALEPGAVRGLGLLERTTAGD